MANVVGDTALILEPSCLQVLTVIGLRIVEIILVLACLLLLLLEGKIAWILLFHRAWCLYILIEHRLRIMRAA